MQAFSLLHGESRFLSLAEMEPKSPSVPILPIEKAPRKTPRGLDLLAERVGFEPTVAMNHT